MSLNRNLWLCRRFCLMRFPRRLRSPRPRHNSVAFCPLGIDCCSQCKHGIGTAQRGAAEVRRLQRLGRSTTKPPAIRRFVGADDGKRTAYSAWEVDSSPCWFVPVRCLRERAFPHRFATPEPVARVRSWRTSSSSMATSRTRPTGVGSCHRQEDLSVITAIRSATRSPSTDGPHENGYIGTAGQRRPRMRPALRTGLNVQPGE